MPNTSNGATRTDFGDDAFVITHPDGSQNFVVHSDDVQAHSNWSAFDTNGAHYNDHARFIDDEGIRVHNNSVSNLGADANYQHLGDHSRATYDDGRTFRTNLNTTPQGSNYVFIVQDPVTGTEVTHLNTNADSLF